MVGVTCAKCAERYRFDDADVPPSGKIVKCTRCGAAITVMPAGAAEMGMRTPAGPGTVFGVGPGLVPGPGGKPGAKPVVPGPGGKPAAKRGAVPPPARNEESGAWESLSDGDLVLSGDSEFGDGVDLSAIPAPARPSPLSGASPVAPRPAPKAGAQLLELPTDIDMSQDEELDLVAPVGPTPTRSKPAAPDLLAPVGPTSRRGNHPADLPAPVGPTSRRGNHPADLPAPVGPTPTRQPPEMPDLMTPVGPTPTRQPPEMPDLMAPVGPTPTRRDGADGESDLLAPVGPTSRKQLPDLLAPVGPQPSRGVDLPAPKGFFDDGLQPAGKGGGGTDLPAPKGFFDDGLQPAGPARAERAARDAAPAGRQFGMPLDSSSFEPVGSDAPTPATPDTFDFGEPLELGGLDAPEIGGAGGVGGALAGDLELDGPAGAPAMLELGDPSGMPGMPDMLELNDMPSAEQSRPFGLDADDLELDGEAGAPPPPSVPLGIEDQSLGGPLPELDLAGPEGIELDHGGGDGSEVVTFSRAAPGPARAAAGAPAARSKPVTKADPFAPGKSGSRETTELSLDIDRTAPPGAEPARPAATPRRAPRDGKVPAKTRGDRRRTIALGAALGLAALGGAGYYGWGMLQDEQTRKESSSRDLTRAEKLLSDDAPGHWEKAAAAAAKLRKADPGNTEALALVAEANFAAALDENVDVAERTRKGDKAIDELRKGQARGPHAAKAEALRAILSTSFEGAVKKLTPLRDGDAKLYLGWALAAREQHAGAVEAFQAALKAKPKRLPALYGLGLSQLELGAADEARKAFQAAIDGSRDRYKRDHIGALIGLAQLAPVSEREGRYGELLARSDLDKAPPRAVSRLKALAGDEALRAGRTDRAASLYEEARRLDPLNLRAVVGLAVLDTRGGDPASARKRLTEEVLQVAPDHVEAQLALAEVALAEGKLDEALAGADALFARQPPVANPSLLARAHLVRGRSYEASADRAIQEKAVADYQAAIERADPGDFTAAVRLSVLLSRLGKAAEAREVLAPVEQAARRDPDLALTLGGAFLAAGHAAEAVAAFQSAVTRRPDDLEARYQLGQALFAGGKVDEAVSTLRAAFERDASREDIGLSLARILAASGRVKDAAAVYEKMLAGAPTLSARARAGRFFARHRLMPAAIAQGQAIRAEQPRHPAGLFLLGEEMLAAGKFDEAQSAFRDAARLEPDAQYFEGLGRAAERLGQLDEALRQFARAVELDPNYLRPRVGRARVRLVRREYTLAIDELEAARALSPESPEVLRGLGQAHLTMRNLKEAVPFLERAARLAPDDPEAHYYLGSAYSDMERSREAATHLARAVAEAPEGATWRADAYRALGYAARAAGNKGGAKSAFRTYLELDQKDSAQRRDVQRLLLRLEAP